MTPIHVDIATGLPGFSNFFGSWLVQGETSLLVDVGPAKSADALLGALDKAGVSQLDWVLITHIHIDHAGALAAVLDKYPMARAVCHKTGVKHVVDPEKLWNGSLSVLGDLAKQYGRPGDVDPARLVPHDEMDVTGLSVIETPGHAPHHLSFHYQGHLFAGEAGGNMFLVNGTTYLRPATPHRFFLEEAVGSVERILELPDGPIYYAHYDHHSHSRTMLSRFRDQLLRWRDILAVIDRSDQERAELAGVAALLEKDPELSAYDRMDEIVQNRETTFMRNSIRGYFGYLKETGYKPE